MYIRRILSHICNITSIPVNRNTCKVVLGGRRGSKNSHMQYVDFEIFFVWNGELAAAIAHGRTLASGKIA